MPGVGDAVGSARSDICSWCWTMIEVVSLTESLWISRPWSDHLNPCSTIMIVLPAGEKELWDSLKCLCFLPVAYY